VYTYRLFGSYDNNDPLKSSRFSADFIDRKLWRCAYCCPIVSF